MIPRLIKLSFLTFFMGALLQAATPTAILNFDAINIASGDALALTERFRTEIQQLDTSRLFLDRNKVEDVLQEQGFQETFCTDENCAVEIGNLLGVEEIIVGSIARVGATYTVNIHGIRVATGEIVHSVSRDYTTTIDEVLKRGMRELAYDYVKPSTRPGTPAVTDGNPNIDYILREVDRSLNSLEPLIGRVQSEWSASRQPLLIDLGTRIRAKNEASLDQDADWMLVPGCSGLTCSICGPIGILVVPIASLLGYYDDVKLPDHRQKQIQSLSQQDQANYQAAYKHAVRQSRLKRAMVSSLVGIIAGSIIKRML